MNLDEYRALKAKEQNGEGEGAQVQQPTTETTQETVQEAEQVQSPQADTGVQEPQVETPSKIKEHI